MVGTNTGAASQSFSQHDHEKETCMETAVSDTVTTVTGVGPRGSLAACAQSCRAKSLGTGASLADKLN